jgi:transcriptional regulator with XRE-family HTH domain
MAVGDWLRGAFGKLLKELREERGLSQAQLALECELDQSFLSLIERGRRQPSLSTFIVLCEGLNVEPETVMRRLMSRRRVRTI